MVSIQNIKYYITLNFKTVIQGYLKKVSVEC